MEAGSEIRTDAGHKINIVFGLRSLHLYNFHPAGLPAMTSMRVVSSTNNEIIIKLTGLRSGGQ